MDRSEVCCLVCHFSQTKNQDKLMVIMCCQVHGFAKPGAFIIVPSKASFAELTDHLFRRSCTPRGEPMSFFDTQRYPWRYNDSRLSVYCLLLDIQQCTYPLYCTLYNEASV